MWCGEYVCVMEGGRIVPVKLPPDLFKFFCLYIMPMVTLPKSSLLGGRAASF